MQLAILVVLATSISLIFYIYNISQFYYILGEVITLLGFITFSIKLSANSIKSSAIITFSGNYYIIGCYMPKYIHQKWIKCQTN